MYFAFIMGAVNTLTVTYYLAIEKVPFLNIIFPSFTAYVAFAGIIGVPLLILAGYIHYKRSGAHHAEVEVSMETDPFRTRFLVNSELILMLQLKLIPIMIKISNNEKISDEEIKNLNELQKIIEEHKEKRTFENKLDVKFMKEKISHN